MASVSSVNGKKVSKLKFNDTIFDMGGSKNEPITITANGVYTAPDGVGYSPVNVSVPQVAESGTLKNLLDTTKKTAYLFQSYNGTSVNDLISYNDTENVTKMDSMFINCRNLTTIPQLNTSNATTMESMFENCSKLMTISQVDTSNVTNMRQMFYSCIELQNTIKLDTIKVTNMYRMFYQCKKLTTIDITYLNAQDKSSFLYGCFSLTKLIIRNMTTIPAISETQFNSCYHFTGTTSETYNPQGLKDGRIYVPDDKVDELKAATNWSVYADIIVPLSTLVE